MTTFSDISSGEMTALDSALASPPEMDYFGSCLRTHRTMEWLQDEKATGRKVIGLLGWGAPAEVVLASGGVPVWLVARSEEEKKSRRELSRDVCPIVAASYAGARALTQQGLLDAVVVPGTCDWKRKLSDLLADSVQVFMLESPSSISVSSIESDLKRLAREMAIVTDLPLTPGNLRFARESVSRGYGALVSLQRLQIDPACSLSGADALAVQQSFMRDDISRWTEHCRSVVRTVERRSNGQRDDSPSSAPRILVVGSPVIWKQGNLVELIEEAGAKVVCNDFHSRLSLLRTAGTSSRDGEATFKGLVARWARTAFCSLVGADDEDAIFRAIDGFNVHGVVVHVYRACARLQMKMPGFIARLRDRGIPSILLETEGEENENRRLLARIQPFIEMLLARRGAAWA